MARPTPEAIERAILDLLAARAPGATICPSEAARALAGEDFRPLMDPVRETAWQMAARDALEITQAGEPVERDAAPGPIRLRLPGGAGPA